MNTSVCHDLFLIVQKSDLILHNSDFIDLMQFSNKELGLHHFVLPEVEKCRYRYLLVVITFHKLSDQVYNIMYSVTEMEENERDDDKHQVLLPHTTGISRSSYCYNSHGDWSTCCVWYYMLLHYDLLKEVV